MKIQELATNGSDIDICFFVMKELRQALTLEKFKQALSVQEKENYKIIYIKENDEVVALAGYRMINNLAWGRFLYVDDLIVIPNKRSYGLGKLLINELKSIAMTNNCNSVHLDSGVQRFQAHKFYLTNNFSIKSHHFSFDLGV